MLMREHELTSSASTLALSGDSKWLAAGCDDHHVRIWDLSQGTPWHDYVGHTAKITSLDYSRDGINLLSSSADGTARVWSLQLSLEKQHFRSPVNAEINAAAWYHDSKRLVFAGDDGTL